jgi:hypothetical protein
MEACGSQPRDLVYKLRTGTSLVTDSSDRYACICIKGSMHEDDMYVSRAARSSRGLARLLMLTQRLYAFLPYDSLIRAYRPWIVCHPPLQFVWPNCGDVAIRRQ